MEEDKILELEKESVGKLLWKYSTPAVIGILVMSTYNIIDRIFIGQGVGATAIAGLAITFPIMLISTALGVLIGVGSTARISIALGEKNMALAEKILGNELVYILIIGVLYTIILGVFLKPILTLFGASELTLPYAYDYMIHVLPGLLIMNICYSFNNVMRASGYPQKAMITMIIGAVGNVILDPIFIFGLDMGIRGAAIATVISMGISAVFVMWHFIQPTSSLRFRKNTYKIDWKIFMSIISIGAAPFLVNATGSAITAILNKFLYTYGNDNAIGASGIFNTYTQLLVMLVIGICQGMQPIIGYNYGAKKFDRMKRAYKLSVVAASVICVLGWLGAMIFPSYIAKAFTTDAELIEVTRNGLYIGTCMFWMVGFQIVSTNFFQSIGIAGKSIFLSLTRQILFFIPLLFILSPEYQLNGVWMSFPISDSLATIVTIAMIMWQFKKFNKITTLA